MLVSVLLVLAASGACLGQSDQCTTFPYPSEKDCHGLNHAHASIELTQRETIVIFTNTCATTNCGVFHVCDDKAPAVIPTDMFNVTVIRQGACVGSITLSVDYFCD